MSRGFKLLVSGTTNAGKTTLTKSLKDSLVISHDGKAYPFEVPHALLNDITCAEDVINFVNEKVASYEDAYGSMPENMVFDSVSRIYDSLYYACSKRFTGFAIYSNLDKEIKEFADYLEEILDSGVNLIIISHALFDSDENKYNLVGKGSFAKLGGFLSVVDEGIFIETKADKRVLHFRSTKFPARTLQESLPKSMPIADFDLQTHVLLLRNAGDKATKFAL
jgi:hypothetical protein